MTSWEPPGVGQWRRDDSHITTAMTGYLADVFVPAQQAGFAAGFRDVGAVLEGFDVQWVHGRAYQRARIVGAPEQAIWGAQPPAKRPGPGKPPPPFVLRILFALHPELRRRARRAAAVWKTRAWRDALRRWQDELRPASIAGSLELQRIELAALDDRALADHLARATAWFRDGVVEHFRAAPMQALVVGDFIARVAEWTGATATEILATLRGASPASRAGAVETAKIARAVAADRDALAIVQSDRSPAEIVDALRRHAGEVGAATTAYLDHHGLRLVTGLDLYHQPLIELPELIVRGVRALLGDGPRAVPVDPLAELRTRAPSAELEDAYAETAAVYGARDDETGMLLWRSGIMRRAVHAASVRLAERGCVRDHVHALDARPDELVALLRGEPGPSSDELASRTDRRVELDTSEPPVTLGEAAPIPSPSSFPRAVARVQRAVAAYLGSFDSSDTAAAAASGVRGTGASAGVYEGRARVVLGPDDFAAIEAGDILIARHTTPAFNALLPLLGAIVVDRGGLLSHAAIVAREYGIPAVVDARTATATIRDGSHIRVDGTTGVVDVIAAAAVFAPPARDRAAIPRIVPAEPTSLGRACALRDAVAHEFGGKARALASAIAGELPVPDGVSFDANLVDRIVRGDADAIARAQRACRAVAGPWAVRSSAIGEDSSNASFAGQHATVLCVAPDELVAAVEHVHASAHSSSAIAYRERLAIAGAPRMAIVVQSLLRPEIAGVLFSVDPTGRADGRVVEATWGLGEALVAGLVTPDRYRIADDGKLLERVIGHKDLAIEARGDRGTAQVSIAGDRARAACLDDARLRELAALARRCEQLFGGPQDLEWAVANDRLHLLQSRPVTTC